MYTNVTLETGKTWLTKSYIPPHRYRYISTQGWYLIPTDCVFYETLWKLIRYILMHFFLPTFLEKKH